jgi:hypothetical protein
MLPFACGAASTENFELTNFEKVIKIGFLSDTRTLSRFLFYTRQHTSAYVNIRQRDLKQLA